jgi:UDP-N-acetyl-D-mannosaminuronic acid transferase (WecB/TagA/CpsF family)
MSSTQQILGVHFFNGDVDEAVQLMCRSGGVVVVPAAPAMVKLQSADEGYRRALISADFAIADSGLMALLWELLKWRRITRISGLRYLKRLIREPTFHSASAAFFVLPSEKAMDAVLHWSAGEAFQFTADDCYVAPLYGSNVEDRYLLDRLDRAKPAHVVIAIGNGPQEKLGLFLRENLSYRPAIHCIGAALGFLTGDQVAIPNWADRFYLGWLFRLFAQPKIFIPRLTRALQLPWLIFRYGEQLPPLRKRV